MAKSFNIGSAFITLRWKQEQIKKDAEQVTGTLQDQKQQFQRVADSAENAGKKGEVAFGGLVGMALKAVTVMGTVELGLGAINVAADAMTGNMEDASEAIKQLPAGIGPVARQLETLLGTLTGIVKETRAWEQATANLQKAMDERMRISIDALKFEEELAMNRLKIEQQIAILRASTPEEAMRIKAEADATNALADARSKADAFDLKAQDVARGTREGSQRLQEIDAEIEEEQRKLMLRRNPSTVILGLNGGLLGLLKDRESGLKALEAERKSIEDLQKVRTREIKQLQDQADAIRQQIIPAIEERIAAERESLEQDIEQAKTEEARKEAEERLRIAEQAAADEQQRIQDELAATQRMHDEKVRIAKEAADQERRIRQQALDDEIGRLNRTIGLREDIEQKQLRLGGRDIEADLAGINNAARDQFNAATTREERELIQRNRALDIAALIQRAEGSDASPAGGVSSLASALSSLQSAAFQREDPALAQRQEQIDVAKKQLERLEGLLGEAKKPQQAPAAVGN